MRRIPLRRSASVLGAAFILTWSATGTAQRSGVPGRPDDRTIVHVLNRIGFGPAPGDVEKVRRMGLAAYIDQQLQPERIADAGMTERLAGFTTVAMSTRELADTYFVPALMARQRRQRQTTQEPSMMQTAPRQPVPGAGNAERQVLGELAEQKLLRAIYSERQLQEVLVDFWFNHFNVFAGKGPVRMYLTEYERDAIRPHAMGRFRDLLGATAKSPAMLFYLDNWQSAAESTTMRPGPRQQNMRRGLNENYARELMELHTLGVDGGYTQKDVQEVARAFTGWTIRQPRMGGEFRFEPRMHDEREKVVLGQRIAVGGMKDGEAVLDLLARHPSTATFIATKLARRFVADEPPPALVDRAAKRFAQTDGDIREVVRTIVTSPEFFAAPAYRAKVKTPLEFVASAVRAAGVNVLTARPLVQAVRELGMPLYGCQPPTGYSDEAAAWVNTGALLNRMNFAVALTSRRPMGRVSVSSDAVIQQALGGDLSDATRATIAKATEPAQAIALVLGSPEFQKR